MFQPEDYRVLTSIYYVVVFFGANRGWSVTSTIKLTLSYRLLSSFQRTAPGSWCPLSPAKAVAREWLSTAQRAKRQLQSAEFHKKMAPRGDRPFGVGLQVLSRVMVAPFLGIYAGSRGVWPVK